MLMVPIELRASSIHGIGVFLLAPVVRGQLVWRFDSRIDRLYGEDEVAAMPVTMQQFIKTYSCWDGQLKVWMFAGDNSRFVNHSLAPTLMTVGGKALGDDLAAYDLPAGTELTSDYRDICDLPLDVGLNLRVAA